MLCCVDAIILQGEHRRQTIRAIVEIEESGFHPTKVCGKFMTSALALGFVHESTKDEMVEMGKSVLFLQILDMSSLKKNSKKLVQWTNIATQLNTALISQRFTYKFLTGTRHDFAAGRPKRAEMLDLILSERYRP